MAQKPSMTPDQLVEMPFPRNGLHVDTGYADQPPGTTTVGINSRTYEPLTMRARGGSREGLSQYIPAQVLGFASKIQHLNYIVDPSELAITDDYSGPDALDPDQLMAFPGFPGQFVRVGGSGKQPNKKKNKKQIMIVALLNYSEAVGTNGGTAQTPCFVNYQGGSFPGSLPGNGYYQASAENHASVAYAPAAVITKPYNTKKKSFSILLRTGQTPGNGAVQFFGWPAGASASVNATFTRVNVVGGTQIQLQFSTPTFTSTGDTTVPSPVVPNFAQPLILPASTFEPSANFATPPYLTGSAVFGFQTYLGVQLGWTVTQFQTGNPIGVVQTFVFTIAVFGPNP